VSLSGLPSAVGVQPPTIQPPYAAQYAADQIVPDRTQPDGPLATVLGCNAQDSWQQISSATSAGIAGAVTATTTTTYIDYSWLQMQVSSDPRGGGCSRGSALLFLIADRSLTPALRMTSLMVYHGISKGG